MQSYVSATFSTLDCVGGVCIADGYGVQVRVRNKHLLVSDGIGRYRRERIFPRALANLRRLVVLGHEGAVTLEALRWLSDVGVAFVHIDRDGQVLATSAKLGSDDPRIRRAQALAPSTAAGQEASRFLLTSKLQGQADTLTSAGLSANAHDQVIGALDRARNAGALDEILFAESAGAAAYWTAWSAVPMTFAKQDTRRVPDHWLSFGQRTSPITGSNRLAANPANAMLNYLYALLEAEARIAALACGLDPGLGFFHADQIARDSLTLDLMEAVRPQVDLYLFRLLQERTFRAGEFTETRKGVCRVLAPLTHTLAETTTVWAKLLGPVVEQVVRLIVEKESKSKRVKTPLTQANRSQGREAVRRSAFARGQLELPRVKPTCRTCGDPLPSSDRLYCDECLPERRNELCAGLAQAGPAALARLRAKGKDPAHAPDAKATVGTKNAQMQQAAAAWDEEHTRPEANVFQTEILPGLQHLPLSILMGATGLSRKYCADIRQGRVPHPRHWPALDALGKTKGGRP